MTTRLRALLALPLLLTGCATAAGGSSTPAPDTGDQHQRSYSGHLHLTGAASADVDWRDSDMPVFGGSCQEVGAKGNGGKGLGVAGQYQLPPVATITSGGSTIDVSISIKQYHGPGAYDPSEFSGDVVVHTGGNSKGYQVGAISQPVLKTAADGSGELTFTHAQAIYDADAPTLDGDLKWSCTD
ncbi:hypothetical protein [Kutzneria buriramensis]|uniref:hypothetical protein n=1 Tax=Kutzneria buriramensis TaxID=1045776 RepID=UPI000E2304ED|nr:hypothetical protein [Kutzneria buriramensis]